ncbi:MAG: monovalent cation/H(+) antiporter subunit G [Lachnospiraceae bacterium]|nr:monovalent cation/H(+) antiporter subunit G [Lachnospiraceae bacterium]
MIILEWVRFLIAAGLILAGLGVEICALIGVFRFNYVLNRMHIAAMGDTMGLFLILLGVMILSGWTVMTAKLALIVVFFWLGSPVSGHLISEIELVTNKKADEEFEVMKP